MFGRLIRLTAYAAAPVTTFVLLHPVRALRWGAVYLIVKNVLEGGRRTGRRAPARTQPAA